MQEYGYDAHEILKLVSTPGFDQSAPSLDPVDLEISLSTQQPYLPWLKFWFVGKFKTLRVYRRVD